MNLFNDNLDLVDKIVNKMNYGYLAKEDLRQAGLMGLFQASKNFKESENVKFNTYATYYIIGEIKRELRENKLIKLSKNTYKIIKIIKENEELAIEEIANKYGLEKARVIDAYLYLNKIVSLDQEDSLGNSMLSSLSVEENLNKKNIHAALASLNEEARLIIKYRYLENYSQTELVDILELSQSKISRIEKKALQTMRKYLLSKNS